MIKCVMDTEHVTRMRIGNQESFNGSWLEILTGCAAYLIYVSIALGIERLNM